MLAACAVDPAQRDDTFSADDEALVVEIADTLLPTTAASPGARVAGVGPLIRLWVADCHTPEERRRFVGAVRRFRSDCLSETGAEFGALARDRRERFLIRLERDRAAAADSHYFAPIRDLTTRAYFSTQTGMTQALRYVMVPGRWTGCVPLEKGQPAWA